MEYTAFCGNIYIDARLIIDDVFLITLTTVLAYKLLSIPECIIQQYPLVSFNVQVVGGSLLWTL